MSATAPPSAHRPRGTPRPPPRHATRDSARGLAVRRGTLCVMVLSVCRTTAAHRPRAQVRETAPRVSATLHSILCERNVRACALGVYHVRESVSCWRPELLIGIVMPERTRPRGLHAALHARPRNIMREDRRQQNKSNEQRQNAGMDGSISDLTLAWSSLDEQRRRLNTALERNMLTWNLDVWRMAHGWAARATSSDATSLPAMQSVTCMRFCLRRRRRSKRVLNAEQANSRSDDASFASAAHARAHVTF
eukprot:5820031-Prymnesium_polylepis.1